MDATTHVDLVLATAEQVAGMPRRSVDHQPGIQQRVLWANGTQVAGVMTFEPNAVMAEHTHDERSHHIWVAEGDVTVCGTDIAAGGFAHVPPGVPHEVAAGADGCTLFYVFTT